MKITCNGRYEVGSIDNRLCAFEKEDIVLDAGTGQGYYIGQLSQKCNTVCAIDINLSLLKSIREGHTYENVILLYADLRKIPIKSRYFDKIICLEVLEHLAAPLEIIREQYRVLKPKGICVIAVPTYESELIYSKLNPRYDRNKGEHITILRKQQWLRMFEETGFTISAVSNENFAPAVHWIFRSIFPTHYDASSGGFAQLSLVDKILLVGMDRVDRLTFGAFYRCGNRLFPKSWYFYLRKG